MVKGGQATWGALGRVVSEHFQNQNLRNMISCHLGIILVAVSVTFQDLVALQPDVVWNVYLQKKVGTDASPGSTLPGWKWWWQKW